MHHPHQLQLDLDQELELELELEEPQRKVIVCMRVYKLVCGCMHECMRGCLYAIVLAGMLVSSYYMRQDGDICDSITS